MPWVGAVELGNEDVLLLDALDLRGRVELDGLILKGFYEDEQESQWLLMRGKEDEVFSNHSMAQNTMHSSNLKGNSFKI